MLELPVTNDPSQSFVTQLGDVKYQFDIQYNSRSGIWSLTLAVENGATLFYGQALVLGADLLEPYSLGIGSLVVFDYTNRGLDATVDELGGRVGLVWFAPGEMQSALAGS